MKKVCVLFLVAFVLVAGAAASHAKEGNEEAKAMVEKAIALYKAQGKEKAFDVIDDPNGEFKKGALYVFVYDMMGTAVARPVTKNLIGQNLLGFRDPDGRLYVEDRIEFVKAYGKGWQHYKFLNPTTNESSRTRHRTSRGTTTTYSAAGHTSAEPSPIVPLDARGASYSR